MNDRAPIRDRTLILRILVPGLEARLRDKMKEMEEQAENNSKENSNSASSSAGGAGVGGGMNNNNNNNNNNRTTTPGTTGKSGESGGGSGSKDTYLDLEGVTCEPTMARNRTLWNFHCDGATYPAKLVNLPCPVELHKTHDHAAYYKCADVAQMLIVYEDDFALEEAEEKPVEGFPSYYHSGLTPPMKRVVERRFAAREQKAVAPPRAAVSDVEEELLQLMDKLAKDEGKAGGGGGGGGGTNKRSKLPALTSANKVLEEVEEDVVDYEPWMDDYGRQPFGVEFDDNDQLASQHPEIWLSPEIIQEMKEADQAAKKKKQAAIDKKEAKRKEKQQKAVENAAVVAEAARPVKKGIPSKKNAEEVDLVQQAAAMMLSSEDLMDSVDEDLFSDMFDDKEEMLLNLDLGDT